MALVKANVESDIKDLLDKMASKTGENEDAEKTRDEFASGLAEIVVKHIKTASVNLSGGTAGGHPTIGILNNAIT